MVALSVSISARISPSEITSPTCFNHFATVPSSMVSLSLGMFTTIAISFIYEVKMDNLFARTPYRTIAVLVDNLKPLRSLHILSLNL